MYAAIQCLEKHLGESYQMQSSPSAQTYINELKLAINLLKKYQEKMNQQIELELLKQTNA